MKKISPKNNKNNWSDSEHTQSLQNRNNERFGMTENFRQTTLCRNVQFQDRGQGEGWHWQKALKTAALTLAMSFFIAAPAMANNTPPVPAAKTDNSVYQLVETPSAGENTITKYEYNEADKTLTPTHYELQLNNLNLGEGNDKLYINWENGELQPSEQPHGDDYITINFDSSNPSLPVDIDSSQHIDSVTGTFIAQSYPVTNTGIIDSIDGIFVASHTAIDNYGGKIGDITGYYISNEVAVENQKGSIDSVDGVFIGNGAAIYNSNEPIEQSLDTNKTNNAGYIGSIKGTFISNFRAIDNDGGTIGDIAADFIGNYAYSCFVR